MIVKAVFVVDNDAILNGNASPRSPTAVVVCLNYLVVVTQVLK